MIMNVLHVMGMDSTKYGGIERFNVCLTKQLIAQGHKVIFVYERYPDCEDFIRDIEMAGGVIKVINSKNPFTFSVRLIRLILSENINLLHGHFTKARFYAIPIAYLLGVRKLFFTIHSTMAPLNAIKLHTKLWFKMANRISKVIAVSKRIEQDCKNNWKDKINVKTFYLGVGENKGNKNEEREKLNIKQDEIALLTVANFNQVKGLDVLCSAIQKLKEQEKLQNVKLYIVGQPDKDKKELLELIKKLEIESYVNQIGISNQVSSFLLSADIYLQTSRHEGLGLAIAEACATGLPIVASDVGGIPEIVKNDVNGFLVPPENPEILAEKISILIENSLLRQEFSLANQTIFENFKVENNVSELIKYYKQ